MFRDSWIDPSSYESPASGSTGARSLTHGEKNREGSGGTFTCCYVMIDGLHLVPHLVRNEQLSFRFSFRRVLWPDVMFLGEMKRVLMVYFSVARACSVHCLKSEEPCWIDTFLSDRYFRPGVARLWQLSQLRQPGLYEHLNATISVRAGS